MVFPPPRKWRRLASQTNAGGGERAAHVEVMHGHIPEVLCLRQVEMPEVEGADLHVHGHLLRSSENEEERKRETRWGTVRRYSCGDA
jgi:hypothetical protein